MKLYKLAGASALAAFGMVGTALAGPVPGGNSDTWTETNSTTGGIYINNNQTGLLFDTKTERKQVPGRAAQAHEDNSGDTENSTISRPGSTLVDPGRTLE